MTRELLVSLPSAMAPPGGRAVVLEAPDGIGLRVGLWMPPAGEPARGSVLLLHGFTEFIEKYYEVVQHLLSRGFAVVTYDHRGQGLSQRLLPDFQGGYQTDFADLVAEAVFVHEHLLLDALPRPHLLMAHSMGGNIALRVLQDYPRRFDRAVLSAPMLGFDRIPLWLMHAVANVHVWLGLGGRYVWGAGGEVDLENPVNRVTSDAERHARAISFWRHEPDLVTGGVTWRWVREATRSIALVTRRDRMAQIETPTLLVSAGRDLVVSSRRHGAVTELSPQIERVQLHESMHEILQETDEIQAEFWNAFDAFVAPGNR